MKEQNSQALTAYENALGFANAFRLLFSKSSYQALLISHSYNDALMVFPTIVNGAFACELFLKALIQKPSRGHSITELIKELDEEQPGKSRYIMQLCIELMRKVKNEPAYDSQKYYKDIASFDKAFIDLRYWHEKNSPSMDKVYSMDFLEILVFTLQMECQKMYGPRPLPTQQNDEVT